MNIHTYLRAFDAALAEVYARDSKTTLRIPSEGAHHSGMKPPTDSEMISPTVPR
jgi:hypothetical protein